MQSFLRATVLYTLSPNSLVHWITSDDHSVKIILDLSVYGFGNSPLHEQKSSGSRLDCKSTVNSPVQLRRNSAQRCEQKKKSEGAALHCPNVSNSLETLDLKSHVQTCMRKRVLAYQKGALSMKYCFSQFGEIRSRRIERAGKIDGRGKTANLV